MIYEFIATLAAGFALAGLVLIAKHFLGLFGLNLPKWLIPIAAALGMLGFQIHQEYRWHVPHINQLPESAQVVREVRQSVWYRPWSHFFPQMIRFAAVTAPTAAPNVLPESIKRVDMHLYERRVITKIIPQWIDCQNNRRADVTSIDQIRWLPLENQDPMISTVCAKAT